MNPDAVVPQAPPVLTPNLDLVKTGPYEIDEIVLDNSLTLVDQFKKGWRTTEFWLTLISVGFIAGSEELGIPLTSEQVVGIVGGVAAYVGSRGWLKVNRVKGVAGRVF